MSFAELRSINLVVLFFANFLTSDGSKVESRGGLFEVSLVAGRLGALLGRTEAGTASPKVCFHSLRPAAWLEAMTSMGHGPAFQPATRKARFGSTAVHPGSCANWQQWVVRGHPSAIL
jgi:hypothetical protein